MICSMSLNERVSENVKVIAVSRGTTPTAIARSLGRSHQWIQAKLAGRNQWSLDDVELIAGELDVTPSTLIGVPLTLQVAVRPEGLEPPTFWTVVHALLTCAGSGSAHSREGWVLGA